MWRPATKAVTGTNDVPVAANKRRFGLPEEAAPPMVPPPANYSRPPPQDMQFFNGRIERDRGQEPPREQLQQQQGPPPSSRWDERAPPSAVKEERKPSRWDERREEPRREERRDDRGYDAGRDRDRERDRERDMGRERDRRYDDREDTRGRDREPVPADDAPRKRKSRWGAESQKVELPGLPSQITGNVSQTELDNYAIHVRLEEIGRKLRTGDVIPPPGQRSPSPPPEYDPYGRRTNTLDIRYRKKLEDERLRLIDRAMKADPTFKPPTDVYAGRGGRFGRPSDKVYIPVKEFPEINFFGLLVGPRGNTLKTMERQSGAKISIRGKGSVKEGKQRPGDFPNDEDDELHCLVMADDEAKVRTCVGLINKVIETAASTPEGQNDHKRHQLRELASLNGTLRDDENQLCQNCGEKGHRRWECPAQRVYSANVICRLCGGAGHMARDCKGRGDPNMMPPQDAAFDSEYSALMRELGEGGGQAMPGGAPQQLKVEIPPWRLPENWQNQPNAGGYRGPPGGGGGYQQGGYGQQQQQQNPGYGYGQAGGQQGYQGGGGGGGYGGGQAGGDAYSSYYAGLGQQSG